MGIFEEVSASWEETLQNGGDGVELDIKKPGGKGKTRKASKKEQASEAVVEAPREEFKVYTTEDVIDYISGFMESQTTLTRVEPYTEEEIRRVAAAWAPVATKYQFKPPVLFAFIVIAIWTSGPKWIEAWMKWQDRKNGIEEEEEIPKTGRRKNF